MAELGVELVKGDLDDPASYAPALKGADGVFLNANCELSACAWGHLVVDIGHAFPWQEAGFTCPIRITTLNTDNHRLCALQRQQP